MATHDPRRGEVVDGVRKFRRAGHGIEIDPEIAHQPFDEPGAPEIVGRQREALATAKCPPSMARMYEPTSGAFCT